MRRVRISSHSPVQKLGDSQLSLSPKFRFAMATNTPPSSEPVLPMGLLGELIPGLPDDVALNCLLRLPVESHPSCRSVCRRWHALLGSKERFFSQRKVSGFCSAWLFVLAFNRCTGKIQWHVLDLTLFSWHTIPPMPCRDRVCPHGLRCVAIPQEGSLLVCGGTVTGVDSPLDTVLRFEMQSNRWTPVSRMLTPRSFFAAGLIHGLVYAAGGSSTNLSELSSAEALCPVTGSWQPVASMCTGFSSYDSAVLHGKLFVTEGWVWPFLFSPRGQVYDPRADAWEPMADGLREGWTGSSVVIDGHLFVISEHENLRVKVYDMESDSWDTVDGSPVPPNIRKPYTVSSGDHEIYVVGRSLHIAVGHVRMKKKVNFTIRWQVVDAPETLCDLTPSSTQLLFG
uniref:F-box/kelch-repeat protein At1g30090 n=1 Tax=Anthurium amnicola TaxID=1678845 RepID=A0A1D1XCU3_9ARAE